MSCARKRQRGVTLLEALIAVALLAALAATLAPPVHNTLRLSSTTLGAAKRNESLRIAENALTQVLSNAVIMDAGEAEFRIFGDRQSLNVTSLAGGSVARRFSLTIADGRLIGALSLLHADNDERDHTEILDRGALGFSYYGRTRDDAPLRWSQKWNSARPPQIVRLELANTDASEANTIIEVPITIGAPLHCAFDPVSRRCRD